MIQGKQSINLCGSTCKRRSLFSPSDRQHRSDWPGVRKIAHLYAICALVAEWNVPTKTTKQYETNTPKTQTKTQNKKDATHPVPFSQE